MRVILERSLPIAERTTFRIPAPAEPLSVSSGPGGIITVSFLVDAADKPLAEDDWEVELYQAQYPVASKRDYYVGCIAETAYRKALYVFARRVEA